MHVDADARYDCPSCGEEIVVPIDASSGGEQEYVEDCPICCAPVVLRIFVEPDGEVRVAARPE